MPIYDFKTHSRSVQTTTVQPGDVIIFEGILVRGNAPETPRKHLGFAPSSGAPPSRRFLLFLEP